jgi:hypothetical protein
MTSPKAGQATAYPPRIDRDHGSGDPPEGGSPDLCGSDLESSHFISKHRTTNRSRQAAMRNNPISEDLPWQIEGLLAERCRTEPATGWPERLDRRPAALKRDHCRPDGNRLRTLENTAGNFKPPQFQCPAERRPHRQVFRKSRVINNRQSHRSPIDPRTIERNSPGDDRHHFDASGAGEPTRNAHASRAKIRSDWTMSVV